MISDKGKHKLLAFHGLDAAKNSDEDVDSAIENSATADDVEALENRAKAGDEALEALADQTLEKYANRIGDKPEARKYFRDGLISNRAETLKVLESLPEPKAAGAHQRTDPVHNRAGAKTPEALDKEGVENKKETARAGKVAARARELQQTPAFLNRHRAAFDQAESEIPAEA